MTIVEVELKKSGGEARKVIAELDPVKVDPKDYKVEFENSQVRVLRVKIGANILTCGKLRTQYPELRSPDGGHTEIEIPIAAAN